jgi:hypothetical protein
MAHCVLNKFTVADCTQYSGAQWIWPPFFPFAPLPSEYRISLTFPNLNPCFPFKKSKKQRPVCQRFLNSSQQMTQTDPKREYASTFSFVSANSWYHYYCTVSLQISGTDRPFVTTSLFPDGDYRCQFISYLLNNDV